MIKIAVTDREGNEREIAAAHSMTLIEAPRDHGVDSVLALCGGC